MAKVLVNVLSLTSGHVASRPPRSMKMRGGRFKIDAAGECAAPQASTGPEERCAGLPVDRTTVAVWIAERQFHSAALAARVARSDSTPNAVGGGKGTRREPHSQGFAGYQHQAVVGGHRCSGCFGPSDAGSLDHGGRGPRKARRLGAAEIAGQNPPAREGLGRTHWDCRPSERLTAKAGHLLAENCDDRRSSFHALRDAILTHPTFVEGLIPLCVGAHLGSWGERGRGGS